MEIYAGQKATIRSRAADPITDDAITDASVVADLFNPAKQPITVPSDRTPDHTLTLAYDASSRFYLAALDTTGCTPGVWTCRVTFTGGAGSWDNWVYFTFTVLA